MSSGGTYVKNRFTDGEEYSAVTAYSIGSTRAGIPSGASIVRGIYYMWNDDGFTGQGWMYEVGGGPTNMYSAFSSNDDVANYVANTGNLDDVFSYWVQHYTLEGWDAFYNAVGVNSGCMDVDHSATT